MAMFDMKCRDCSHEFEYLERYDNRECPACKSEDIIKLFHAAPGVKFIGPGFHQTDYKENHDFAGTDYDNNRRENDKLNKKLGLDK